MRKTHLMVLAIVTAAVVLAIGAVGAYADLASDTTAPTTTTDAVAEYWNTATITATAVDDEGIAYIYHELDDGVVRLAIVDDEPLSAMVVIPTAVDDPLSVGTHVLKYWAQDINGNVEAQNSITFTIAMDEAAPTSTATGATDGAWYKTGVQVHLEATDGDGESGVKELSYALDGADPIVAASAADVTVPAAAGAHTIVYHATDIAGNVEAEQTLTVNVDTAKPKTSAARATAFRGRTAKLRYMVTDAQPNKGTATVVIKIKNRNGRVVKTLKPGSVRVNIQRTAMFRCGLAKGTYKYYVHATDASGNRQSKVGYNRLTVR